MLQLEPRIAVSKTPKTEMKNAKIIARVDKKQAPLEPINRPKKMQETKLKNGRINTQRYIKKLRKQISK
jgi:hypothetical protein